jgi:hypothetical protein
MKLEENNNPGITAEFDLVGRDECMASVWPNKNSRPHWRTFERMKAQGVIPVVRFGRMCWYQPKAVAKALIENHMVRNRFKPA